MRSRALLAPAILLALGTDTVVGCTCDEVLGQAPAPDAVLVFQAQTTPPLDNLVIGVAASPIGQAATTAFTIENRGNVGLDISDVVIAGDPVLCPAPSAGFVILQPDQTADTARTLAVAAGASATVTVQFTASSGQPACAVVEVRSNDPDSPVLKARISGQGDAPQLCADRGLVDFGTLTVGERREEVVTLTSCGTRPFTLQAATLNAQFPEPFELVTAVTSQTLDVGAALPLTVAFPQGDVVSLARPSLPVLVTLLADRPCAFTTTLDFSDGSTGAKVFSIPVSGCW